MTSRTDTPLNSGVKQTEPSFGLDRTKIAVRYNVVLQHSGSSR